MRATTVPMTMPARSAVSWMSIARLIPVRPGEGAVSGADHEDEVGEAGRASRAVEGSAEDEGVGRSA
ncbi:hypothetical protein B4N89_41555 [Embleya scabrispora]|uniref:Uncharacterized protein n=1 Tax=Embleya scabrispora TaxID=159449 RepID=A0A1T3NJN6_9ACTN|nr:hypothetical protein B4N89_41555 [Embleya scabrispora]